MESPSNLLLVLLLMLLVPSLGLDTDGGLLLSLKYAVVSDPSSVLDSWDYNDVSPCLWNGVRCAEVEGSSRVVGLSLLNKGLVGSLPEDIGFIPHLQSVDLSGNLFDGALPKSIFNSSSIEAISMANNAIVGEIPQLLSPSLKVLNLSNNELIGSIPASLASLENLTVVSLRINHLSGAIPDGFSRAEFLDMSENLLNGSLPSTFGGENLKYINLSHNKISGVVSREFAARIPTSGTVDLSYNYLSGRIPDMSSMSGQKPEGFDGNVDLCGSPLKRLCTVPSSHSLPPNVSANSSSPAIAAIPRTIGGATLPENPRTTAVAAQSTLQNGMKPAAIAGIAVAPLLFVGLLAILVLYVQQKKNTNILPAAKSFHEISLKETGHLSLWPCLRTRSDYETSDTTFSDDNDTQKQNLNQQPVKPQRSLVMVDGETELEIETLLRATAYVLGSNRDTIVYRAVLADGRAFAVRRIGQSEVTEMKIFKRQLESLGKLRHENLVRVRGFYWGDDEKLLLHDYISNRSLATISYRITGSSPYQLTFQNRLKIAIGVARGLKFIHSKKYVHGNIKPSNILLTHDMEPLISDLGVEFLVYGKNRSNHDGLTGHSDSQGSTSISMGDESFDPRENGSPPRNRLTSISRSPYRAPESINNLKPNPKWDVYSFGILLLELLTGNVFSVREIIDRSGGMAAEERDRALKMADAAVRDDDAGANSSREDAIVNWYKLGFRCASFLPRKRPNINEALRVLEKM